MSYNATTRKWTDTQNRSLDIPLPATPSATIYTYFLPSTTGTFSYSVRWSTLQNALTNPSDPLRYLSNMASNGYYNEEWISRSPALFNGDGGERLYDPVGTSGTFNPMVPAEITLPNGQHYLFTYNVWGEITKVIYPTGGYERFDYAAVAGIGFLQWPYTQSNRGVVDRWLSSTGNSSDEQHWHYSASAPDTSFRLTVTTTAPDNTVNERDMFAETSQVSYPYGFSIPELGMQLEERGFSGAGGAMLTRKLTKWASSAPPGSSVLRNARAAKEIDILLDTGAGETNALTATTTMSYDNDVNVIATNKYDFTSISKSSAQSLSVDSIAAPSLPLRTTETTYLVNDTTINSATRALYRARNLLSLPTSARVKNSAGTEVAKTKTSYDDYDESCACWPGTYALVPPYGGSIGGWTDPGNLRGLPTTSSVWLDTTNSYLATHAQYDQFGNVRKAWDANGKQSEMFYSSGFSYAYPTSSNTAVPDPNGVYGSTTPLSTIADYNANSGLMTVLTDANGQSTSYTYDAINRLSTITQADGGHLTYSYSDLPSDLYVRVLTEEDASRSIETRSYSDGLGRPIRSFVYEGTGSTPWLVTDTYYDNMGRVWKLSNPYRVSNPGSTVPVTCSVCTSKGYDALGRVTSVTTPDSAQVGTSYSASISGTLGTFTTVTDPDSRKRRSLTDALGRLVRVDEPNKDTGNLDAGGAATVYSYNVVGNLLRVDQDSQRRFFSYDSLGRLLRARNPEQGNFIADADAGFPQLTDSTSGMSNDQWSVGYIYDANGNLLKRRDARDVMTTYGYDALNRNITVRYTDGTKDIDRHYDNPTANKNGLGRFWYFNWDASNNTRFDSHLAIDQYDAMGRPLNYRQHFLTNGVASPQFNVTRTYDKVGHVLTQTYPSGNTVTYGYDVAGRLLNDSGNLGDGVARTYATGITYNEFGGLQQEQFGTQTPLYHKQHYNVRGQLYDMRLSTASWSTDEWNWNRGAIVNYNSTADLTCQGQTCRYNSGPDNNGNLRQSQYWIPGDDQASTYNWTEDRFAYDYLNRLKSVAEFHGSSVSGLGPQDFTQVNYYDRWGNRTIDQSLTSPGIPHPNYLADPNTNQLIAPAGYSYEYDKSGNQKTDNYTGQGSRTYDAENRLREAQGLPNNQLQTFTYDADGRRIKRNLNGVETWQIYGMDGELLAEYAANANAASPQKEYGYRNGQLLITAEPPAQTASTASYSTSDATTQGNWKGVYGADGYNVINDATSYPAYATVSVSGQSSYTWAAATSDSRALQKAASTTDRLAACWYSGTNFTIDVNLTDGNAHRVALYTIDWDGSDARQERIEVLDAGTNAVLDTRDVNVYTTGKYLVWMLRGHVKLKFTHLSPAGYSAVVSGLFFDTPAVSFITSDTTTQGNWKGVYGADGYNVINDATSYPAYATVSVSGQSSYTWAAATSDSRALRKAASPTDRLAACWYSGTNFTIDVNLTDGNAHRVALYTIDWDGSDARQERIEVLDAGTNAVLDTRDVNVYTTGKYLVWMLRGHVKLKFTHLSPAGYSAVVSGLFFGSAGSGTASINWLVSDQLGTPRMIVDQSGMLASVKRHDYLPFGEEISDIGGRTPAMGYSSDTVRQKFTSKERDGETELDYFEARYFSFKQGRFTSIDPMMASAHAGTPQSWNRFAYAFNNPLRFIDPNGLEGKGIEQQPEGKNDLQDPKTAEAQEKSPEAVVRVNVNDTKILSIGINLIDKVDHYGEKRVPVDGTFEITYSYSTTTPLDGSDPSALGRVAPVTTQNGIDSKGTLGSSQQVARVGDPLIIVNQQKEKVEVTKTEKFKVLRDDTSTNGGTWIINYQVVVSSPTSGQVVSQSTLDKKSITATGRIPKPIPVVNRLKKGT